MGMSQEAFVRRYADGWADFEELLERMESKHLDRPVHEFPRQFRMVCRHLAIARSRGYSLGVQTRLERMVERGHGKFYGARPDPWRKVWEYAAGGFARDVRANWKPMLVSLLCFGVPFVALTLWVAMAPDRASEILGLFLLMNLDSMYGPSADLSRGADSDVMMFGFYIYNNVGIALRTFGAGLFFGIGSLFILLFNGVVLGAASGYVTGMGYSDNFWPFVIGHGSFELTAIVLAGGAGLKIGAAPIWPGRHSRLAAIRKAARESLGLILGFSAMLVIAAFIEAFWSPRQTEPIIRYVVGGGLWLFVISYFAFSGKEAR
jgi:uncharacterized membrane protein SpoIIM required for sporulation